MKVLLRKTSFLLLVIGLFLLLAPLTSTAQTSRGILAGVVRDATGAVIQKAAVTIKNEETGEVRTTLTQNDGSYRLDSLTPGNYTVTVELTGFDKAVAQHVVVNPSVVSAYDASLNIGRTSDVVEVRATSNAINTENGQLAGVIGQAELRSLPIFSLNPIELATTIPGVQFINTSGSGAQGQVFAANGARPRANNFLIDGQEVNDVAITGQAFQPDIPDSFNNVAVLTSASSAEYGRAGGAVTNLITRSGTNTFHGSVFERYTGSGLNAIGEPQRQAKVTATPANPIKKTRFDRHTFGFTAGGPIIKNKLFAFGASEWQRFYGQVLGGRFELPDQNGVNQLKLIQAQTGTVAASQAALFSQYLSDYAYLTTYQNVTPNFESLNVGKQPGCPAAGCTVTTAQFQRPSTPQQNTGTQWIYRVDFTPREKDAFAFRYLHNRGRLSPDFGNNLSLTGFDSQQGGPSEVAEAFWTHVFGPRVLNEFRVSEARVNFQFNFTPETIANPLSTKPTISFLGNQIPNFGLNQNLPQGRGEDLYQLQDTVGFTKGRHAVRVGFDIGRQLEQEIISLNALGTLTYANSGTYNTSIGEFLANDLGRSGTATKTFGSTRIDPHGWRSGIFAQDDVKLNPSLTVNLGVRYDYLTNAENSLQYPAVDPANLQNPINTVVKVNPDTNNISPRVGFAYVPHIGFFSDGKTVLHGGFGIFFDSSFSNFVVNSGQASPNAVAGLLTSTSTDGLSNSNTLIGTLTATLSPTSSVTSMDKNSVNPYTYQYNFGFERELPSNTKFTLNYVGSRGVKLFASRQYNYFSPGSPTRLNPARGQINLRGTYASSNYNSLQAELSHSISHGLTFRAAYTYSKDLDNTSEAFATFADGVYASDLSSGGLAGEKGNSAFDHRNYFVVSYVYTPAGLHSNNTFLNGIYGAFTRNWSISGIERFQSGPYSTLSIGGIDSNGDGTAGNERPIVSNVSAPFNTAAVDGTLIGGTAGVTYDLVAYNQSSSSARVRTPLAPSAAHFYVPGGANSIATLHQQIGRNSFLNPGQEFSDVALQKGFGLSYLHFERGHLDLRAEAQNITNHNNVQPLNTNVFALGTASVFNPVVSRTGAGRSLVLWATVKF
jgi:Carboxypeptidase regulatory-like domain/TonB-dependent Receptor Plug Domain